MILSNSCMRTARRQRHSTQSARRGSSSALRISLKQIRRLAILILNEKFRRVCQCQRALKLRIKSSAEDPDRISARVAAIASNNKYPRRSLQEMRSAMLWLSLVIRLLYYSSPSHVSPSFKHLAFSNSKIDHLQPNASAFSSQQTCLNLLVKVLFFDVTYFPYVFRNSMTRYEFTRGFSKIAYGADWLTGLFLDVQDTRIENHGHTAPGDPSEVVNGPMRSNYEYLQLSTDAVGLGHQVSHEVILRFYALYLSPEEIAQVVADYRLMAEKPALGRAEGQHPVSICAQSLPS